METKLQQADLALCRSAPCMKRSPSASFSTSRTLKRLIDEEQNQALRQIAAILEVNGSNGKSTDLAFRVRQLSQSSNLETLEKSYRYLFGFTAQPKVPPYETEYGEEALFQQPQELGDLAGFYSAFGLKVNTHERVDHLSCECEFLAFLTRKEAYALEQNDMAMLEETRRAQRLFLKDHLGRFMPAFVKMLRRENADGFYGRLGDLCHEFARLECARFDIPLGSELMRLRPTEWMEEGFTCGSGEELVQITRPCAA
jgi:DMSO reductase family type II enzyme chaperone